MGSILMHAYDFVGCEKKMITKTEMRSGMGIR